MPIQFIKKLSPSSHPMGRGVLLVAAVVVALAGLFAGQFSACFAQGNLNPPGAPAPTMKTLDQIEPRYPISNYGTNLTVSGSYYLTANISGSNTFDGINIRTNINNITIDLNGFSMICTNPAGGASPVGIRISGANNIAIRNGQFFGFDRGIRVEGRSYGIVVDNVQVHGAHRSGIELIGDAGDPTLATLTVRNCVVEGVDGTGEGASVSCDGIVLLNGTGIVDSCIVRDIVGVGTFSSSCINAASPTNTFVNNNFLSNADVGLKMSGGGTRVYYRNNLTAGCPTPFSGTGGVDRGGNF
jgi:hypothetical protein